MFADKVKKAVIVLLTGVILGILNVFVFEKYLNIIGDNYINRNQTAEMLLLRIVPIGLSVVLGCITGNLFIYRKIRNSIVIFLTAKFAFYFVFFVQYWLVMKDFN